MNNLNHLLPFILRGCLFLVSILFPTTITHAQCTGPVVSVNPKILPLQGQSGAGYSITKLIYRDISNRIIDSCDGDLTFVGSKVLMERILSSDPTIPAAPRTLIPNGTTTGSIGNAGLIDSSGNPATDGLTFNCRDVGTQFVRVWARNDAGNWRFATSTITIQDNDGICEASLFAIAGKISTETDAYIKNATVFVSVNDTLSGSILTGVTGEFNIRRLRYSTARYHIRPTKTIDTIIRNGVTTFDINLVSKHSLGIETLNSPYKIIAADVNKDGEVDAIDMLAMRRFILGITQTFPAGTLWRFIDKTYTFRNPTRPLEENFPEFVSLVLSNIQIGSANFMAVKLGDVNNSFDEIRIRSAQKLTFNARDTDLVAGKEYTVAIRANELNAVAFQGTFAFEDARVKAVKVGNLNNTTEANFGTFNEAVTVSWNGQSAAASEVINMTFVATKSGKLSNMLTFNSAVTLAEAYDAAGNAMTVELLFDTGKMADDACILYQNTPNPVVTSTKIGFDLPKDGQATLTIYNAVGKTLRLINNHYKAGYNELTINKSDLNASGILYYRLDTQDGSFTRKMVVIE